MDSRLLAQVDEVLDAVKNCFDHELSQDYEMLDSQVRQLRDMSREAFQAMRKNEYLAVVEKLESGASLTDEEYRALEMLIVGEAQYYLEDESDFEYWRDKLDRLSKEIEDIKSGALENGYDLMRLQAVCLAASRMAPDMAFYLRQKERVLQFKEGTRQMDQETMTFLANTIKEIIASDKM